MQNLKYEAAFPLLLNISDQPTYFIALKDGAGLVKKYAMVNVQKYQTVAIGDTVEECEKIMKNCWKQTVVKVQRERQRRHIKLPERLKKLPRLFLTEIHTFM